MTTSSRNRWNELKQSFLDRISTAKAADKPLLLSKDDCESLEKFFEQITKLVGDKIPGCAVCKDTTVSQLGFQQFGRCPARCEDEMEELEVPSTQMLLQFSEGQKVLGPIEEEAKLSAPPEADVDNNEGEVSNGNG